MAYKNKIDSFDPERGDVVSMPREDIARLYACGVEICGPILWTFFGYVLAEPNTPIPTMPDPRDNAILKGLIEHQRRNAHEHFDKLQKSREAGLASAAKRAERRSTAVNQGQQVREEKYKPKNSVSVDSSALYGDASVTPYGGDSTPTASPPTAVIGSAIGKQDIIGARATVAQYAPEPKFVLAFDPTDYDPKGDEKEIDCKKWCDDETRLKCKLAADKGKLLVGDCRFLSDHYWIDKRAVDSSIRYGDKYDEVFCSGDETNKFWRDYCKARYSSCADDFELRTILWQTIEEKETERGKAAVAKFRDTLGETFKRAVWTFYIQANAGQLPENDAAGNATNYGKLLFGRLKKLVEAKAILAQVDETRQRSMPPPPIPQRSAQ